MKNHKRPTFLAIQLLVGCVLMMGSLFVTLVVIPSYRADIAALRATIAAIPVEAAPATPTPVSTQLPLAAAEPTVENFEAWAHWKLGQLKLAYGCIGAIRVTSSLYGDDGVVIDTKYIDSNLLVFGLAETDLGLLYEVAFRSGIEGYMYATHVDVNGTCDLLELRRTTNHFPTPTPIKIG